VAVVGGADIAYDMMTASPVMDLPDLNSANYELASVSFTSLPT